MIPVNELRIGNYASFKSMWSRKISEISGSHVDFGLNGLYPIDDIYPVPLNEIILEKSGFLFDKNRRSSHFDKFTIVHNTGISGSGWHVFFNENGIQVFYYLHQLQNLYFSITGEELTVNL